VASASVGNPSASTFVFFLLILFLLPFEYVYCVAGVQKEAKKEPKGKREGIFFVNT